MRKQSSSPLHVVAAGASSASEVASMSPLVREAHSQHEAARGATFDADGAVQVAAVKLREARDNAPVSARLSDARAQVAAARSTAERAAEAVDDASRAAADAEGVLEGAQAEVDDIESGARERVRPAQIVRAQKALEKAEREVQHCRNTVVARQEEAAAAETRLASAEELLSQVSDDAGEHSSVLAARHALAARERALVVARQQEEAAKAAFIAAQLEDARGDEAQQQAPVFASVDAFVESYVLENWRHLVDERDSNWCALWWCHAEAVTIFEAMWEAFEAMRRQPAPSMSVFLRDHFVPHMRNLTADGGAFHKCSSKPGAAHHEQLPVWQHVYAPAHEFPVNPDSQVRPERDLSEQQGESA